MAPVSGYWGKVTATLDWCEENYVVSPYIAEFWNTISNVLLIVPPLLTILMNMSHGVEKRIVACFIGITVVGIGSWSFHMTLLYPMQLLDELPMLYGSAFLLYTYVDIEKPLHYQNYPLAIFLSIYCVLTTWVYVFINEPVFHETAYGLMVTATVYYSYRVINNRRRDVTLWIGVVAVITYLSGFLLWNIDNKFCPQLKTLRGQSPAGVIFQLHAGWHLLAGIGTYLCLLFMLDARYRIAKLPGKLPVTKFWLRIFPYVVMENVRPSTQVPYTSGLHEKCHN